MPGSSPRRAIIIGATSGLGAALARLMANRGYAVGLTGRRRDRLESLKKEIGVPALIARMDISRPDEAVTIFRSLKLKMGGVDTVVLNAGVSALTGELTWENERYVIDINVRGIAALAVEAYRQFEEQGYGRLVAVSSVAGLFGRGSSPAYNASKAFLSTYMQGYRQKARRSPADITVTNLLPGYVRTEMTAGNKNMFWSVDADYAARQMLYAIEHDKARAYIPRRWWLPAQLARLIPDSVWDRL